MSDPGTFPQLCLGSDLPLLIPLAGGIMQKGFFLCTKTRSADFPSAGLFILGRHNQHFRRSHQYTRPKGRNCRGQKEKTEKRTEGL